MKVVTILGTRPEIIRLSLIIKELDKYCDHTLVHTGQNFDAKLSDIFFNELEVRSPDIYLGITSTSFPEQIGQIIHKCGEVLARVKPDRVLILGDTNSGLASIVASRMRIPVYHMEAGNRCYDDRVPEEINRRIIDHSSNILMPYTQKSKENLLLEGIEPQRIYVVGNPIYEVLDNFREQIDSSSILERESLSKFFLVTLHRAENVDSPERLKKIVNALEEVSKVYQCPVIVSGHPRLKNKLGEFRITPKTLRISEPFGFFDFVKLEKSAYCVLTDSGTVQEECSIFNVPNVTLRDVTERGETLEAGSNIIAGVEGIERSVKIAIGSGSDWIPPVEYTKKNVSKTVAKIILGHFHE